MSEQDKGMLVGAIVVSIVWALLVSFFMQYGGINPHLDCEEDEILAWQQNEGDYPDNVVWSCISEDSYFQYHYRLEAR